MTSSKIFLILLAIAACAFALPSTPVQVGQVKTGKLFHALFDQTSACTPKLSQDDLEQGIFVGIPRGRSHCNEKVQLIRNDGSKFLATVVESTLPTSTDYHILGSRGVLRQMGVSDQTETLENVKWSLCDQNNNC